VRKKFRFQEVAFAVLLTSKSTEWHASDSHFDLTGHTTRDRMEKPDPYGEWVLHNSKEAKGFASPQDCWQLKKGETTTIDFLAQVSGTYAFKCCHTCGLGHRGMKSEIVVD
jgi:hypothetical protein